MFLALAPPPRLSLLVAPVGAVLGIPLFLLQLVPISTLLSAPSCWNSFRYSFLPAVGGVAARIPLCLLLVPLPGFRSVSYWCWRDIVH